MERLRLPSARTVVWALTWPGPDTDQPVGSPEPACASKLALATGIGAAQEAAAWSSVTAGRRVRSSREGVPRSIILVPKLRGESAAEWLEVFLPGEGAQGEGGRVWTRRAREEGGACSLREETYMMGRMAN